MVYYSSFWENIIQRNKKFFICMKRLKPFYYYCFEAKKCHIWEKNFTLHCFKHLLEIYQIMPVCICKPVYISVKAKSVSCAKHESVEKFALRPHWYLQSRPFESCIGFSIILDTRCRSETNLQCLESLLELFLNSGVSLEISYFFWKYV